MEDAKMKLSILSYFFISFVLDGLLRLSGLFVMELLQSTDLSRQDAVVPFILSWVVSNIAASFSSILNENKHSERIILFGILLCATGTTLCTFATNITTLIVCWGLLFGSGYGLAYPHLSIRLKGGREKLSPILQMTPSLGATIMPFVFSILTSYYALQGSFLIFCGIILNYMPLALAAAHDFEISIPNIKWRVRKKSSQYSVSKYEERKPVSVESFINSLEPDVILEINQTDRIQDECKNEYSIIMNPATKIPPIGRKRSETRGNDLQGLDSRFFPQNKTPSRLFAEVKKYENDRNIFEDNLVADNVIEQSKPNANYDTTNSIKALEKNIPNYEVNSDLNSKYKILDKITEQEVEDSVYENNEIEKDCYETCNSYENNSLISTSALSESEIEQNINENNSLTSASKLSQSGIEYTVDEYNSFTSPNVLLECQIIQNDDESNGLTSTSEILENAIKQNTHESDSSTSPSELIECEIIQNVEKINSFTSACGLSESDIKQTIHESNSLTSTNELLENQIIQNVDENDGLTSPSELIGCQIIQNVDEINGLTSPCGLSESEIKQNIYEINSLSSASELLEGQIIQNIDESNDLTPDCGLSRSDMKNFDVNKAGSLVNNTFPTCDQYSSKDQISSQTKQDENTNYQTDEKSDKTIENQQEEKHPKSLNCSSPTKKELLQSVQKENVLISPNSLRIKQALNTSMVIKIHVEECTFTANEKEWAKSINSKKIKSTKDNYIKNSKSVKIDMHEHKLLDNQKISKRLSKCSKLCKSKLSGIYSISENCDQCDKKIYSEKIKQTEKMCNNQINVQQIVKYLEVTTSRVWLSILLMSVIFEINLVTLLTIFADFGNDVDSISSDFKWILVAFGIGGFIGKICCCKISRVIPEKYHAIGVILFLLNGLATAGILYSTNLNWLAGFYCILGALEGGITYVIPKFIFEYIDEDVHSLLMSVKYFFSGVAIMCIPYGIGLFRDDMGDYEFLLQILSCSSILCAFIAYFLPRLIPTSHKKISAF